MNRIDKKFKDLKKKNECALIPFITAGDPTLKITAGLVKKIAESGADIIELGIPFSDPIADGPTIQASSTRALKNKADIYKIFNMVKTLRNEKLSLPIVFMTYFNIVNLFGFEKFAKRSAECGVDGIIVPDLPPEEAKAFILASGKHNIDTIFLAAPTSTSDRLKLITSKSKGFVYYVSLLGVTGARKRLAASLKGNVIKIKKLTKKPVCVGFGVSTGKQARFISGFSDGVIIGSAIVKLIEKNIGKKKLSGKVASYVKNLKSAVTR